MTTLYLVRHCEAEGNTARVFQGSIDRDISPNGQKQLDRLAERFRDVPLAAVYSSPLLRAYKTAQAVNRYHGLPIVTDDRLKEINGGVWEGLPWAELPQLYPEDSRRWLQEPWRFHPQDGEAMPDVYARMAEALTAIAAAHDGQTVAVTSHGCAIRNALCWAHGLPVEQLNTISWCDNTAVACLEFDGPAVRLVYENDNSHLEKEVSTFEKQSWWRAETENPFE